MKAPGSPSVWIVAGITLVGLALRLSLFDDSLVGDELSTHFVVTEHGLGSLMDLVRGNQENTPPLYYLLAWLTQGFGGEAEGLRLPSLLAGTAAIPITYMVGTRTVERPAAIIGAALVALSPFLIFYSTEARAYSLALALALLSTLALLEALSSRRALWWVLYAAGSCGAVYAHYPVVFVLVAQFAWAFAVRPRARRALMLANGAAALAFLAWLPGLREDLASPTAKVIAYLNPFSADATADDFANWVLGIPIEMTPLEPVPGAPAAILAAAGLVLAAGGLLIRSLRGTPGSSRPRPSAELLLVVALAVSAPLGIAAYSALSTDLFLPRNLVASWPGLALSIGALLMAAPSRLRAPAVCLVLAGFAIGGAKMLDPDHHRPDTGGVASFIERTAGPGDPVVESLLDTPGPRTAMEVAVGSSATPGLDERVVLGLDAPSLAGRLRLAAPGGQDILPYPILPPVPAEQSARRATELAPDGRAFLVVPGSEPLASLASRDDPVGRFLRALPRRRLLEARTFPGLTDTGADGLTVYVLQLGR